MSARTDGSTELVSYLTLRRVLGALGVAMPVVVALWGFALTDPPGRLLPSLSDYYAYHTRDVFVGTLFAIGLFLFTYGGYDWRDELAGKLGCVFALGVAVFPCMGTPFQATVHFCSAAALFLVLAVFAGYLFTRTDGDPTPQKLVRNRIYHGCAICMLASIVLIAAYKWLLAETPIARLNPVFWLETLALWAFGIAWFVKGETLFRDRPASQPASSGVMPAP